MPAHPAASSPANLALLLHMHQPLYVDPDSGQAILPWVRLHGTRAYLDVARLLEEFEAVRLTVNFVPSLLEQLESLSSGVRDPWLDLTLRERGQWSGEERAFIVSRFFSVDWTRGVETRPRFRGLLEKRGRKLDDQDAAVAAARFSDAELRDLTVLFHLAWMGFAARESHPAIAELEAKGQGYSDDDARVVIETGLHACARVLPLYRKLAARGQVELTASPRFHPIVPLLLNSDVARRAQPGIPLPERFSFADDGRRQIKSGIEVFQRVLGERAQLGMWPPEGCVSPEAVRIYGELGVRWLATDEGNLWRSLEGGGGSDGKRGVTRAELYRAYRYENVDLVFRDRDLSDRVGFSYAHGDTAAGVADLLGRVRHAADLSATRFGDAASLVPVVLDGENPWEAYPGSGEPFLRALFGELSRPDSGVRAVTIGDHLQQHPQRIPLTHLHSGSWIDSDFHIWIGDPVKNRAWNLLGRARRRWQRAADDCARSLTDDGAGSDVRQRALDKARHHLDAAEGSDWFWWFGEPFHNAEEALFDRLFRAHLCAAWRALGDTPPLDLDEPVSVIGQVTVSAPRSYISPRIDGRLGSYFEWVGAGRYEVPRGASMSQAPIVTALHFGLDAQHLYLRCDPHPEARSRVAGAALEIELRIPPREIHLHAAPGATAFSVVEHPAATAPEAHPRATDGVTRRLGRVACDQILELALPLLDLELQRGQRVELSLRLVEGDVMLGRYPRDGYLEMLIPEEQELADVWL